MNCRTAPTSVDRACPELLICRCLKVTEEVILAALHRFELRTVKEVCRQTGAGDGCTACHRTIGRLLEQHRPQAVQPALLAAATV
jgi:bacterioferritin-associated ferredoxin